MAGINNKQLLILRPELEGFGLGGEPTGFGKLEERGNRLLVQFGVQALRPANKGEYVCIFYFSGNDQCFALGNIVPNDAGNGFLQASLATRDIAPSSVLAAGVMYLEHGFLYPVLCGHKGGGTAWLQELIGGACTLCGAKRGNEYTNWEYEPSETFGAEGEPDGKTAEAQPAAKTFTPAPLQEGEPVQASSKPSFGEGMEGAQTIFGGSDNPLLNRESAAECAQSYYECNADNFERLLRENEPVEGLNDLIPGSEWVRVEYNDKDAQGHYILGIIYDEARKPLYICYGIPGTYAPQPPPNITGFCQWIPEKAQEPDGKGYWMMYQNAQTGARYEEQG